MNPAQNLLASALLVAVGILLYDAVARSEPSREAAPEQLTADDVEPRKHDGGEPSPTLDTGGGAARLDHLVERVRSLEAEIALLRKALAGRPAGAEASGSDDPPGADRPSAPILDIADVGDAARPEFDERTLAAFGAYMGEIERRKLELHQRARIDGQLERLGDELSAEQKQTLGDWAMAHHKKMLEFSSQEWPRDEQGRLDRIEASRKLQEDWVSKVNKYLPPDTAQKVLNSRVVPLQGFRGPDRRGRAGPGGR